MNNPANGRGEAVLRVFSEVLVGLPCTGRVG